MLAQFVAIMPSDSGSKKRDRRDREERKSSSTRERDREREHKGSRDRKRHGDGSEKGKKDRARGRDDHERRRHLSRSSRDESERQKKKRKHDERKRDRVRDRDRDDSEDAGATSDGSRRRRRSKHSSGKSHKHDRDRKKERHQEKKKSSKHSSSQKGDRKKTKRGGSNGTAVKLHDLGPKANKPPSTLLDPSNDYFSYHEHLRLYLYRTEGTYFEDLSSPETHKAFKKFCSKYNKGELETGYYEKKLSEEALEQCKRTQHAWKFKISVAENKSLDLIKSGVKKQTAYEVKDPIVSSNNSLKNGPMVCVPVPTNQPTDQKYGGKPTGKRAMIVPRDDAKESQRVQSAIGNVDKRTEQEAVLRSLGLGGLNASEKIKIAPRKE